jgi:hypothetical protein
MATERFLLSCQDLQLPLNLSAIFFFIFIAMGPVKEIEKKKTRRLTFQHQDPRLKLMKSGAVGCAT